MIILDENWWYSLLSRTIPHVFIVCVFRRWWSLLLLVPSWSDSGGGETSSEMTRPRHGRPSSLNDLLHPSRPGNQVTWFFSSSKVPESYVDRVVSVSLITMTRRTCGWTTDGTMFVVFSWFFSLVERGRWQNVTGWIETDLCLGVKLCRRSLDKCPG